MQIVGPVGQARQTDEDWKGNLLQRLGHPLDVGPGLSCSVDRFIQQQPCLAESRVRQDRSPAVAAAGRGVPVNRWGRRGLVLPSGIPAGGVLVPIGPRAKWIVRHTIQFHPGAVKGLESFGRELFEGGAVFHHPHFLPQPLERRPRLEPRHPRRACNDTFQVVDYLPRQSRPCSQKLLKIALSQCPVRVRGPFAMQFELGDGFGHHLADIPLLILQPVDQRPKDLLRCGRGAHLT